MDRSRRSRLQLNARKPNDSPRLIGMVALLAGVLIAIMIVRRPETWSGFEPESPDHPGVTEPAPDGSSPAVDVLPQRRTPPPNRLIESLKIGAIIVLAIAYLTWRVSRLVRRRSSGRATPPPVASSD